MIFRKSVLFTTLLKNVGKQNNKHTYLWQYGYVEKVVIFDSVIKRDLFLKLLTSKLIILKNDNFFFSNVSMKFYQNSIKPISISHEINFSH